VRLPGDPRGSIKFDLGESSYFAEVESLNRKYYGAFYDIEETNRHHTKGIHEYLICRTPIEADVFINIPKLKTHSKVGLTVNLKSLVGVNGDKNWLPHFSFGSPEENGDQFDKSGAKNRLENKIIPLGKKLFLKNRIVRLIGTRATSIGYKIFGGTEKVVRSGNWHGNDTCWRMSLDLNKILLYGNSDGNFVKNFNRKKYFSVVDGIIGMEGNGPVTGHPINMGLIILGCDPLNVDLVCAKLMGFDYQKIRLLARSFDGEGYKIHQNTYYDICVVSNIMQWNKPLVEISQETCFKFKPHFGWCNHIEIR